MEKSDNSQKKPVSPQRIMDTASAFYDSSVLLTASDLGIFARLSEVGAASTDAIADICGLNRRATRLLMDACATLGLLSKEGDSYSNTPETAAFLVPASPSDLSQAIRYNRDVYAVWGKLGEFMRTGKPVERPELHLGMVFPGHNDILIFFGVLHQESEDSIVSLLKKAYDATAPGGIIYVLDMMTDATRTQPKFSALFAVNMALTAEHGWVFSDQNLKSWLAEAGFVDFSCQPLPPPMPHWLASACKP